MNFLHFGVSACAKFEYVIRFSFQNAKEERVPCNHCIVKVRLINSDEEEVYSNSHELSYADFVNWTWSNPLYQNKNGIYGTIYISSDDIKLSSSSQGKMYIEVTTDDIYFSEKEIDIDELPCVQKTSYLKLSGIPKKFKHTDVLTGKYATFYLSNVTYDYDIRKFNIYISGEIIKASSTSYSTLISLNWKLLDNEGYVIDTGTFIIGNLGLGDKIRDMHFTITADPGIYTLEF